GGLGGLDLLGGGGLGGLLRGLGGVELGFGVGPGGVELRGELRRLGGGLLLDLLGVCLRLVGLGGGEHLLGMGEVGVGALLGQLQLLQCRRRVRGLARRLGGGDLRLVGGLGGR